MLKAESLIDGTVDLAYVALLNDSLAVRHDNEALARRKAEKDHGR
jgi:uncharacterized protein DUF6889